MFDPVSAAPVAKRVLPYVAAILVGGTAIGYGVHEHNGSQRLAAQNAQVTAQLNATQGALTTTQSQLDALSNKVNEIEASAQAKAAQSAVASRSATVRRSATFDSRFRKLQTQLDAQGKAIDQARNDLNSTQTDLSNTRTELTGSIARTHDELVVLEKKGELNYFEFDLTKSKEFKREGPLSISLRKANSKHGYADLMLIVDDRNLSQKHVNLYQPAMFYEPDSPKPVEVVINDISKDHIHGYVSAPKYHQSELAALSNNSSSTQTSNQAGATQTSGDGDIVTSQPAQRQKLPTPTPNDPNIPNQQ
ncbi:MAG TPA: hypothetical protein VME23_08255 [Terracidiphilus sp.]|jgi:hypothetical protein|nr:hypothetical protein [Terracidiphilus sp.]